jgi:hypothetical protein
MFSKTQRYNKFKFSLEDVKIKFLKSKTFHAVDTPKRFTPQIVLEIILKVANFSK